MGKTMLLNELQGHVFSVEMAKSEPREFESLEDIVPKLYVINYVGEDARYTRIDNIR
jgi:hypothetical protein